MNPTLLLRVLVASAGLTAGSAMSCTPYVASYSNSGCLPAADDGTQWPCDEDQIELTVEGNTLQVVHRNATYNCCANNIIVFSTLLGDVLRLAEDEIVVFPCFCSCCYDVEATVVGLLPGTYTVEFCWEDDELGERCHKEEIVVP